MPSISISMVKSRPKLLKVCFPKGDNSFKRAFKTLDKRGTTGANC